MHFPEPAVWHRHNRKLRPILPAQVKSVVCRRGREMSNDGAETLISSDFAARLRIHPNHGSLGSCNDGLPSVQLVVFAAFGVVAPVPGVAGSWARTPQRFVLSRLMSSALWCDIVRSIDIRLGRNLLMIVALIDSHTVAASYPRAFHGNLALRVILQNGITSQFIAGFAIFCVRDHCNVHFGFVSPARHSCC